MKKLNFLLLIAVVLLGSCSKNDEPSIVTPTINGKVAVLLPDGVANARWSTDCANISKALKQFNASDVVYYTSSEDNDGASKQAEQIKNSYNNGVRNFIITAIDYKLVNDAMKEMSGVNVVCHDRLIRDNSQIGAYSSCDAYEVGKLQAQYLILAFTASGKDNMNLEMLAGPSSDENSKEFYNGAFEVLKTYINNGSLNIVSGKKTFSEVALSEWTAAAAKAEMTERLKKYTLSKVDMVLAPNDGTAEGVVAALEEAQYGVADFPVITGQDNSEDAQKLIAEGKMFMTVDKSLADMAYNSVAALVNLMKGCVPSTDKWVDNGSKMIPFLKSTPVAVLK